VAHKAGKAVPAMALAGALTLAAEAPSPSALAGPATAANPAIHARPDIPAQLTGFTAEGRTVAAKPPKRAELALHRRSPRRSYVVQPGDTLSGIAIRFYGRARAWMWLFNVNRAKIRNPNLIFPGQVLLVPYDVPVLLGRIEAHTDQVGVAVDPAHRKSSAPASSQAEQSSAPQGTLGCSGLEALWRSAGGSPSAEVTAASVAMAESSGNQYATGPFGERGYWQINPDHGALSTYAAYGNAQAAVIISDDGTNWSAWTTYDDGAYLGRC
jgi:LysM repeat protein